MPDLCHLGLKDFPALHEPELPAWPFTELTPAVLLSTSAQRTTMTAPNPRHV
ncbi:MAG: hypothetical protein ACFFDI_26240 [Promethearchaeota archaeon]